MSQYNYVITIKQPDYKTADAVSLLMLTLALAMFGYTAWMQWLSRSYHTAARLYIVIEAIILLSFLYAAAVAKRLRRIPYYRIALAAAAIGWFTEPLNNYWIAALYLLAASIERQVKVSLKIGADDNGIVFNSLLAKSYPWKDINNVLLKENMLTIDYRNNKIFQKEIEADVNDTLEKEFNAYCRERLNTTAPLVPSSD